MKWDFNGFAILPHYCYGCGKYFIFEKYVKVERMFGLYTGHVCYCYDCMKKKRSQQAEKTDEVVNELTYKAIRASRDRQNTLGVKKGENGTMRNMVKEVAIVSHLKITAYEDGYFLFEITDNDDAPSVCLNLDDTYEVYKTLEGMLMGLGAIQ